MSMTLFTNNFSTTLAGQQFTNLTPAQQPASQLLESLAGLFAALAPLMQGLGFQGNAAGNRFGNIFQQPFGPQGFPQGFGPQGFPQGFGPQGFPLPTGFSGTTTSTSSNQLFIGQMPMTQDRAVQLLRENWDKASKTNGGKGITRESLEAAIKGSDASAEFKAAVQYLLGSDLAFKNLDRANATKHGNCRQKTDGFIARSDLDAALGAIPFTAQENQVAQTLLDNLKVLGNGNEVINQGDLGRIAVTGQLPNGQPASPALLAAARYALANPSFFGKLDDAFLQANTGMKGPHGDGLVGADDLKKACKR